VYSKPSDDLLAGCKKKSLKLMVFIVTQLYTFRFLEDIAHFVTFTLKQTICNSGQIQIYTPRVTVQQIFFCVCYFTY
jgi:hypothetical protein